ncbi:MAG: thermonuclease family protein [Candidatus Brachytrichaceae bacterium NZ_4S206]|jgi:micrococcal nuclease
MLVTVIKRIVLPLVALLSLIGVLAFFLFGQSNVALPDGEEARVVHIVDGDTIHVEIAGQTYRVRYIGVDAPESTSTVECFGREATNFNRALVAGQRLRLERDVNETDRYGRLLRYAYLPDGRMVNEVLVREGYALARSFPPDVKYQDRLRDAEREARQARRGLWGRC